MIKIVICDFNYWLGCRIVGDLIPRGLEIQPKTKPMKNYINASTIIPGATAAIVLLLSFVTLVNADIVLGFGAVLALGSIAVLEYRSERKSLLGL